ncbi:MAG: hypothetical protein ACI8X5_001430 [Planctomycetota bacterium]
MIRVAQMDPFAQKIGPVTSIRPSLSLNANLAAVMQEGRIVAGEVLQTFDGKSLLIGVAGHKVPADSGVDLQLGDRFLARVEQGANGVVLRVLGPHGGAEPKLLQALRSVVANDRPVGELLGDLASKLRGRGEGAQSGASGDLLKQLGEHIFRPGASIAELRQLLARSGMNFESQLLAMTEGAKPPAGMLASLSGFTVELLSIMQSNLSQLGLALSKEEQRSLEKSFLLGLEGLELEGEGLRADELLARLAKGAKGKLSSVLKGMASGVRRDALLASLEGSLETLLRSKSGNKSMQQLLRHLLERNDPQLIARNLKGQILAALAQLPAGEASDAAARTLAGIESEQLLNLARREFNEGWHLSLPVPDGDRWATAHVFYHDSEMPGEKREASGDEMQRLTVAVDFSALGPLRAEIGVRDNWVGLRLVVSRPEIAERLQGEASMLAERLSVGGREARISVVLGEPKDTAIDALSTDIRWLREHHLMDLSG